MLDIKYVRENTEDVAKALANRNAKFDTKKFLALEEDRRKFIAGEEELQANRRKNCRQSESHLLSAVLIVNYITIFLMFLKISTRYSSSKMLK